MIGNAIRLSYFFKCHVVKFRFLKYPLMENTFHTYFSGQKLLILKCI